MTLTHYVTGVNLVRLTFTVISMVAARGFPLPLPTSHSITGRRLGWVCVRFSYPFLVARAW